ncbi:hypothetical protein INS49_005008 [Diaporthe citri]|uniref:uncharacterized protein n=1 Tax=Diaporthe citri TaxID=83186 RepID=UPI001C80B3CA|nr:uncharacterized protein INS49_005008 [Diaporthe citri]KAG6354037.1 hypothetical protein INS49_005008 [Diaporthe citri]
MDFVNMCPVLEVLFFQRRLGASRDSQERAEAASNIQMDADQFEKRYLSDSFEKLKSLNTLVFIPHDHHDDVGDPDFTRDFLGPYNFLTLKKLCNLTSISVLINVFASPDGSTTGHLTVSPTEVLPRSLMSFHILVDDQSGNGFWSRIPLNEAPFQPRVAALGFMEELTSICPTEFPGLRQVDYIWAVTRLTGIQRRQLSLGKSSVCGSSPARNPGVHHEEHPHNTIENTNVLKCNMAGHHHNAHFPDPRGTMETLGVQGDARMDAPASSGQGIHPLGKAVTSLDLRGSWPVDWKKVGAIGFSFTDLSPLSTWYAVQHWSRTDLLSWWELRQMRSLRHLNIDIQARNTWGDRFQQYRELWGQSGEPSNLCVLPNLETLRIPLRLFMESDEVSMYDSSDVLPATLKTLVLFVDLQLHRAEPLANEQSEWRGDQVDGYLISDPRSCAQTIRMTIEFLENIYWCAPTDFRYLRTLILEYKIDAGRVVLFGPALAIKIAASLQVIEHTPLPYAIKNFYEGQASIVSGGVASLPSDKTVDLGANADYQGLIQYGTHKNIRMIYTIVDVPYRVVANKAAGINTLADLRGKRIGTMSGSSAKYFISKLLNSAGVKDSEYTVVSGNVCMKAPCGAGTLPAQIQAKTIDGVSVRPPSFYTPELGGQVLGDNAIFFQNATVFREIYSLFTTTDKLNDPTSRRAIVEFIRALDQAIDAFKNTPEKVYQFVAQAVGMDAATVQAVWPVHKWAGTLGVDMDSNLIDYMVDEDIYVASQNQRQPMTRDIIAQFVDNSVIADARNASYLT